MEGSLDISLFPWNANIFGNTAEYIYFEEIINVNVLRIMKEITLLYKCNSVAKIQRQNQIHNWLLVALKKRYWVAYHGSVDL